MCSGVHISAFLEQSFHKGFVAASRRYYQSRSSLAILSVHVSTFTEQNIRNEQNFRSICAGHRLQGKGHRLFRSISALPRLPCSAYQRCPARRIIFDIYIRAFIEQETHDIGGTGLDRAEQRHSASGIYVSAT